MSPNGRFAVAVRVALLLPLLFAPRLVAADPPRIEHPVTDLAGAISPSDERDVESRLVDLRERTGVQMAVLVVDTTAGVPIDDYAQEVFDQWGGGSAERDDGVLFVLAIRDRRNRLHLGYGLEPVISDGQAAAMLADLRDALRAGDYGGAVRQIVDDVAARVAHLEPGGAIVAPRVPVIRRPAGLVALILLAWAAGFAWYLSISEPAKKGKSKGKGKKKRDQAQKAESDGWASWDPRRQIATVVAWAAGPLLVLLLVALDADIGFAIVSAVLWLLVAVVGVLGGYLYRKGTARFVFFLVFTLPALFVVWAVYDGASVPSAWVILVMSLPFLIYFGVIGALCAAEGGTGGGSYSSSSSSWSSSSYSSSSSWSSSSSSSYSSSSSWSGGGGSSGGGGASSSW